MNTSQPRPKRTSGRKTLEERSSDLTSELNPSEKISSPSLSSPIFFATITGRPIVKKNSKRLVKIRGRMIPISSDKYRMWERDAVNQLLFYRRYFEPITQPLELVINFYFKDRQGEADLSNLIEGPQDALQLARVIENDKQIVRIRAEKFFGSEDRVEISLYSAI